CCGGGTSEMPPPPCPGGAFAPSESHVTAAKHIRRAAAWASAAYFAPPVRQGMPAVPVRDSDLQHHRNDHRSAAVGVAHPAAHRAAHHTADLLHVDHPVGGLLFKRLLDLGDELFELRRIDARTARVYLRPRRDLAGGRVDHDDHGDEAL